LSRGCWLRRSSRLGPQVCFGIADCGRWLFLWWLMVIFSGNWMSWSSGIWILALLVVFCGSFSSGSILRTRYVRFLSLLWHTLVGFRLWRRRFLVAFCGFSWWQHWGVDLYLVGEAVGRFMVNCGLALSLAEKLLMGS
jgi:hypothetical protein